MDNINSLPEEDPNEKLALAIQKGEDPHGKILQQLINQNLGLLTILIRRYLDHNETFIRSHEADLLQECGLVIHKAVKSFDPKKGKFTTHISLAIKKRLLAYKNAMKGLYRIETSAVSAVRRAQSLAIKAQEETRDPLTLKRYTTSTSKRGKLITTATIKAVLDGENASNPRNQLRPSDPTEDGENNRFNLAIERIAAEEYSSDEKAEPNNSDLRSFIARAFPARLKERNTDIIMRHYGFESPNRTGESQAEIAASYGLGRTAIQQVHHRFIAYVQGSPERMRELKDILQQP